MVVGCGGDDDMRMDHSNFTATSTKFPYKTSNLPNKGTKKMLWSTRFFRFVHFICPIDANVYFDQ